MIEPPRLLDAQLRHQLLLLSAATSAARPMPCGFPWVSVVDIMPPGMMKDEIEPKRHR